MGHSEHGSQGFYSPSSTPDAQLVGGGLPCPFLKTEKKYLILQKRCPVCVHLWVQF